MLPKISPTGNLDPTNKTNTQYTTPHVSAITVMEGIHFIFPKYLITTNGAITIAMSGPTRKNRTTYNNIQPMAFA
jgi:hypothetical protein